MTVDTTTKALWPNRKYAWYVVVLLTLAYALTIIDRVSLGLLVEPITTSLDISDTQFGLLHGVAFIIFFVIAGVPMGMGVDKWSRKYILLIGLVLLAFATLASGFATSFLMLFMVRTLIGAGESSVAPAASSLIADYFPENARAKAYGVYASGIAIGSGIAFILSSVLYQFALQLKESNTSAVANFEPWQITLILLSIPGIALSLLVIFTLKEPKRQGLQVSEKTSVADLVELVKAKRKIYLGLTFGLAIAYMAANAYFTWYAAHLMRSYQFTLTEAGSAIGAISVPFGMFSALSCGWAISYFQKKGRPDAPIICLLIMIVVTCSSLAVSGIAPSAKFSLVFFALSAATVNWGIPCVLTAINQITPNQFRGQLTAIYTIVVAVIAVGLGPLVAGAVSDYLLGGDQHIGIALSLLSLVCGVIGFFLVLGARKAFLKETSFQPT
ncbi:MAG: MFS transporter [Acidiferrobacterales bacterium]|nr:MFS transporter [Acidiferrobacterales bacterium]